MFKSDAEDMVKTFAHLGLLAEADQTLDPDDEHDRPDQQWSVTVHYDQSVIATVSGSPGLFEWSPDWGQALATSDVTDVVIAWTQSRRLAPPGLLDLES